ncbi:related to phospholipid-translocating ATPase [Cephalotrichum gorgonifer]|uniref:Related to phospholipid-translocating ATPase n=1 Tax=Cephalotrichum gorgonifer TaxID=2041049 RepID=A0AAE8SUG3_9PEZI|nr:related to phospholipid-translocating ATPase [Cephalotrichum gorgonifer]
MSDGKDFPSYDTCKEITDFCRVEFTVYGELFTKGACIFFAAAYLLLLVTQVFFGIKAKTWSFMIWLALGTGFEMVGYAARTIMADNPWKMNAFIIQYLTLLLGPTLVAAAISITFKHIVLWYGPEWSVMRPKLYPWVFVGTDILSILIQVVGGGIMTMNTTGDGGSETSRKLAEVLLIGGVSFQVANMLCCAGLMLVYWQRRKKSVSLVGSHARLGSNDNLEANTLIPGKGYSPSHQSPEARKVRLFVRVVAVAYLAVIIRCCYR